MMQFETNCEVQGVELSEIDQTDKTDLEVGLVKALFAALQAQELMQMFPLSEPIAQMYAQSVLTCSYLNALVEGYSMASQWCDGEYMIRKDRIYMKVHNNGRHELPAYRGSDWYWICADTKGVDIFE